MRCNGTAYHSIRGCILGEGGVPRTGSRASLDCSRDCHRGSFSRLESGTTTPLPPRSGLVSVRISFTSKKKIDFMIVLYIFNLFSMLNLDFRLVSQCICLLVVCILPIIDLVCCFHVSCVSKWSSRYLTCLVCAICVPFRRMFGGIFFRSVNVIWLHLLGFAFICFSCSHFSIFVICPCNNLTVVSGFVCLTSIEVSSANVSTVLLVVVGMFAVYNVYSIGPRTLPCDTTALMSLTSEYVSLIFIAKVLLLR